VTWDLAKYPTLDAGELKVKTQPIFHSDSGSVYTNKVDQNY
jgi:hypothetical protein